MGSESSILKKGLEDVDERSISHTTRNVFGTQDEDVSICLFNLKETKRLEGYVVLWFMNKPKGAPYSIFGFREIFVV